MPNYEQQARQIARKYKIPEDLFLRLIKQESGFNPRAVSPAGAIGLGQLMPGTARGLGVDPHDPTQNLTGSARYLADQYKRFGKWDLALSAYNSGPGGAEGQGRVEGFAETQKYVKNILNGAGTPGGGVKAAKPPVQPGPSADLLNSIFQSNAAIVGVEAPPLDLGAFTNRRTKPVGVSVGGIPVAKDFNGSVAKSAAPIVALAKEFLGTPYSWGGGGTQGPSKGFGRGANTVGFDCSSFLQFLWAKQGVQIPRVTYDQFKAGKRVAVKQLKPGDAVFFRMGPKGPEHVGMWIGNGQFVHAPKTGDVIKVSRLSGYYKQQFVGGRRYG